MSKEIFLVEDDIDHAELITTFLKVDGITNEIVWFKDAESSIERLNEIEHKNDITGNIIPALIIIDLKLPRMDGFQLISHIRTEYTPKFWYF